ncbi:hypothetical protein RB201_28975 [Streptomyces sp. S1A(2023)]
MLSSGVLGTARIIHYEMYEHFLDADIEAQLNMLTSFSALLAGPLVLLVLARKGVGRTPAGGAPGPWGGSGPWGVQPPGHPPYGAPGQPPAQAPGFGPPPASPPVSG